MKSHHKFNTCMHPQYEKQRRNGRIWAGAILVTAGGVFLAKALGYWFPAWLFTWPVLLVLLGIYTLGKHGFSRPIGLLPLGVGLVFLIEKIDPSAGISKIAWPAVIIFIGLAMLLRPNKRWKHKAMDGNWNAVNLGSDISGEDFLQVESIFGGVEKNVLSKQFKGGKISTIFGGAEINLMQCDIQGTVSLEVEAIFGGVEITVPSHWKVQTEISAVLGGVEDSRPYNEAAQNSDKVLILKGSAIFGGVSVKAY